jgi:L-ascorbate metabolism protein UlaG (beta-lactamase superfamily)
MIQPALANEALLADIASTREQPGFRLWWLGQSGFLLQWQQRHLLFDPYLSDSLTRKYGETDKPHVRMTELVVAPRCLDFIDVVTSSHNHTDHLDGETLGPLLQVNPDVSLVVPAANLEFAATRLKVPTDRLTAIDDQQSLTRSGFSLHAVASAHETVDRDDLGRCRFLGYVVRFGEWSVYHSGDTVRYEGLGERLAAWNVDLALLPINGRAPERRVAGNLGGREAAQLARDIGARLVIPCHFDMFEFNTATPDEFVAEAQRLDQAYAVLACGQRWSSQQLG